ncbi:MAG TPA: hypothetical protein ENG40_00800 [Thermoprotei archaeon]|nr:hypothetical protein [Thermoprotei archaeon]
MRKEKQVMFKEDEKGNKYPYIDFGSETHGRKSFRLWVSGKLVKMEMRHPRSALGFIMSQELKKPYYYVEFPLRGARIIRTPKGNLVLKPDPNYMVYYIFIHCGYRGGASFEILTPKIGESDIFEFKEYASPRGSLGVSIGALVNVPIDTPLKYRWERTGRLYGDAPQGITIVMPNGEEKEFEMLPDGLEALGELPKMEEE